MKTKGQVSIELLIILGIVVIGAVLFGVYYLNNIRSNIKLSDDSYNYDNQFTPGIVIPTCYDGIQNGNESGIDCGDICLVCSSTDCANTVTIFSPIGGTYFSPQSIRLSYNTINCPGAHIYYTTDGTTPTSNLQPYNAPIILNVGQTTIKAKVIAIDGAGTEISGIPNEQTYNVITPSLGCDNPIGTVTFSPAGGTYSTTQYVTLNYNDPNCSDYKIYYTIDGNEPTKTSNLYFSDSLYSSIRVLETTTIKAKVFAKNSSGQDVNGDTNTQIYNISVLKMPIATPNSGIYPATQTIVLSLDSLTPLGAIIRYTTDGSKVNDLSSQYVLPIPISDRLVINAKTYKSGMDPSAQASFNYLITPEDPITFSNLKIDYMTPYSEIDNPFTVSVIAKTEVPFVNINSVEIKKNGWVTNSCSFLGINNGRTQIPIECTGGHCTDLGDLSETYSGEEYFNNFLFSCSESGNYSFKFTGTLTQAGSTITHDTNLGYIEIKPVIYYLSPPKATPISGFYPLGTIISLYLDPPIPDAIIRYTTNGSEVTETSPAYNRQITLNQETVLKARAYKVGTTPSSQAVYNYFISESMTPRFGNLEITNLASQATISFPFNVEVTAQANLPIVYLDQVEIKKNGNLTNACQFLGITNEPEEYRVCSNGICEDLGYLTITGGFEEYYNTFKFKCDETGTYTFRFRGELGTTIKITPPENITIPEPPEYDCSLNPVIPGQIWCLEDLDAIRNNLLGTYILMRDLDFENNAHYRNPTLNKPLWTTGEGWVPLGTILGTRFSGVFEGNNKKISHLYINRPNFDFYNRNQGLFGNIQPSFQNPIVQIRNLGLEDVNITGADYIGALAGDVIDKLQYLNNSNVIINNCYSSGVVKNSNSSAGGIGGLIGRHLALGPMENCHSSVDVNSIGDVYSGGLIGVIPSDIWVTNYDTIIDHCYSTGNVFGEELIGGLIGHLGYNSIVRKSYSTGNLSGNMIIGGLVAGLNDGIIEESYSTSNIIATSPFSGSTYNVGGLVSAASGHSVISNSYSTGDLIIANPHTSNSIGGFIGSSASGWVNIENSYSTGSITYLNLPSPTNKGFSGHDFTGSLNFWDTQTSGQSTSPGSPSVAIIGKTTSEMKTPSTFSDWNSSVWAINSGINNGYPYLQNNLPQ
ncbi:MAG: chitobiase/beta-hexosaminidase C-terminal domain-containing protein [archaeon]|jgi:hypothetical protein